jgi:hypothetical protein
VKSFWLLLDGGPFAGETRNIPGYNNAVPPEIIHILDSADTMLNIMNSEPGAEVPLSYAVYNRVEQTGAGPWLYEFATWSHGHFVVAE